MDFVFGSFAEWMGVLDNRPGSTHCSLSPAEWESALDATGYVDTLLMTSSGGSFAHLAFISQAALSPVAERSASSRFTPTPNSSFHFQSCITGSAIPPNTSVEHDIKSTAAPAADLVRKTVVEDPLFSLPHESEIVDISSSEQLLGNGLNDNLTIVRSFSAGGEVDLVRFLSHLDSMKPHTVWLYTDTEESNSTLIGLVRSIRHEFTLWKVMMVLFHPSWDQCRQQLFIYGSLLSLKWIDSEILVDEGGGMRVPRVVTAFAPPLTEAREDKPVEFDQSRIWRAFPAPLGPEDVEIAVAFMSLSPAFADCSEFSGQVTAVGSNVSSGSFLGKRHVQLSSCPVWMLTSVSPPIESLASIPRSGEMLSSAIVPRLRLFRRVCTSRRRLPLSVVSALFPLSSRRRSLQQLSKNRVSSCTPAILLPPP